MRVFTFTLLSGVLFAGAAIASQELVSYSASLRSNSDYQLTSNNSRSRDTSYRGSGRREILALPISNLTIDA